MAVDEDLFVDDERAHHKAQPLVERLRLNALANGLRTGISAQGLWDVSTVVVKKNRKDSPLRAGVRRRSAPYAPNPQPRPNPSSGRR